jgi:hypothetical protein
MTEPVQIVGEIPTQLTILEKGAAKGNYILQMRGNGPFLVSVTPEIYLEDNSPEFEYCEGDDYRKEIDYDGLDTWVVVVKSASPVNIEVQHRVMRAQDLPSRPSGRVPMNPQMDNGEELISEGITEREMMREHRDQEVNNSAKFAIGALFIAVAVYIVYMKTQKRRVFSSGNIFDL